jgi:hypothetical protein
MRTQYWDDDAFKRWVEDGASAKGMTVAEVLNAVGASRFYFKRKNVEGRSINVILNIADVLGQSPAPLFGMAEHTTKMDELLRLWRRMDDSSDDDGSHADPRLGRMIVASRIFATQLASLVCVASDRADTDPAILARLILA